MGEADRYNQPAGAGLRPAPTAKYLILVILLGIACHVVLLGFEVPIITSAVQSILAQQPITGSGVAGLLIAHLIINTGLGLVFALLAKPQAREALIYGGIAAGLPNSVCTLAGALIVIASEGSRISDRFGLDLLAPGMVFAVILFALFTGLLAAPLGMVGAALTMRVVSAK